jgi:cell division protein FtsB
VRRLVWPVLVGLAGIGVLFLFVLPGRTLLAQEHQISQAQQRITVISQENGKLSQQIAQLKNPAVVAQRAHQEFGLVFPGQKAIVILPPTATPSGTTATTVP